MEIPDDLRLKSLEDYKKAYKESVDAPEKFWGNVAEKFKWKKKWSKVLEWDFEAPKVKWFQGGKLNITENCLDRHLTNQGDKDAIIWVPNDPKDETKHITYNELYERVTTFANVLKQNGIQKGDRVCIYMPMIPELTVAMLACARIGAIHAIVFAGFSVTALSKRINNAGCKMLITANGNYRGKKYVDLKAICDETLEKTPSIETVIVKEHADGKFDMKEGRDKFWRDEIKKADKDCPAEEMDAEDPLFILHTSGSTGTPKGMVHTTAGYMVGTTYTFQNVFQPASEDVYWCTADIGWITGHSYIVYGPLSAGATSMMFAGVPSYPDYGRFWQIVEEHKITHFYTAPTAIRALATQSLDYVTPYDLSSLKVLGSVGEPINEEAWEWYDKNIGKGNCPIVDTWWQTETGMIMISTMAGINKPKPRFATLPLPGVQPVLMDDDGNQIKYSGKKVRGRLAMKAPWPALARTIWNNHKRYKDVYFSTFKGKYFSGDGAYIDEDGDYRITGRVDDVIIVSGHNLETAPVENAINEHEKVSESAIVGYPHDIKGKALYAYLILYDHNDASDELRKEIKELVSKLQGPIAKPDKIQFVKALPKTRSAKIMRRILRKIAAHDFGDYGDTSTLLNPEVVKDIEAQAL